MVRTERDDSCSLDVDVRSILRYPVQKLPARLASVLAPPTKIRVISFHHGEIKAPLQDCQEMLGSGRLPTASIITRPERAESFELPRATIIEQCVRRSSDDATPTATILGQAFCDMFQSRLELKVDHLTKCKEALAQGASLRAPTSLNSPHIWTPLL